MDKKFEKLLNFSKAFKSHQLDVSKTFEFELFKETNWFMAMNEWHNEIEIETLTQNEVSLKVPLHKDSITRNQDAKIKVLFIGDTYQNEGEDLLHKMILAMNLKSSEFERLPLDLKLEEILDLEANLITPHSSYENLLNVIREKSPEFVISLGATITNIILGRREKMSAIHGRFFDLEAQGWKYKFMPIFHPDFLLINPNMKRTTWIDLQKVMEYLGQN